MELWWSQKSSDLLHMGQNRREKIATSHVFRLSALPTVAIPA